MITLKRLNVVRKVATEEQAAKLERLGFARTGGTAEAPVGAGVTEADLAKMGEAMFERLSENLKEAVAKATAQPPKRGRGGTLAFRDSIQEPPPLPYMETLDTSVKPI